MQRPLIAHACMHRSDAAHSIPSSHASSSVAHAPPGCATHSKHCAQPSSSHAIGEPLLLSSGAFSPVDDASSAVVELARSPLLELSSELAGPPLLELSSEVELELDEDALDVSL